MGAPIIDWFLFAAKEKIKICGLLGDVEVSEEVCWETNKSIKDELKHIELHLAWGNFRGMQYNSSLHRNPSPS